MMDKNRGRKETGLQVGNGGELAERKAAGNVCLCPDGKYRWVYEFDMLKNPSMLITIIKGMALSFGIVLAIIFLMLLLGGDLKYWDLEDYTGFLRGYLILLAFMLALSVVSYIIVAGIYGWKYMVLFEMNEKEVRQIQMQKQFQKAEAMGWLAAMVGLATGNLTAAGTGILAASRNVSTSVFASVRNVKVSRLRHTIHVNQLLDRNQVYADGEDFDFVLQYILDHVPAEVAGRAG